MNLRLEMGSWGPSVCCFLYGRGQVFDPDLCFIGTMQRWSFTTKVGFVKVYEAPNCDGEGSDCCACEYVRVGHCSEQTSDDAAFRCRLNGSL